MNLIDAKALKQQIQGLPTEAAAVIMSDALNHALDTDTNFFGHQNWDAAFPVLVWLAQHEPAHTEVFFEKFEKKFERSNTDWARKALHNQVTLLQREKELKALTEEELEAQLVFTALLPGGKPATEIEQEALIRALLVYRPEHACVLATNWWGGSWLFDETVERLFEACWQVKPEALLSLLTAWRGARRESFITRWIERVIEQRGPEAGNRLVQLLILTQGFSYREQRGIDAILDALPLWDLEGRRPVLAALLPVLKPLYLHMRGEQQRIGVQILERLWLLDSGPEWEWQLHELLYGMTAVDRVRMVRRLRRSGLPQRFTQAARAMAIVVQRGKTLQDYLNRKYVRPDHRRRWRRFLALEAKIQKVEDKALRTELLKNHAAVVKETSRARKGLILAALNTDTAEPICVRPARQK